MERKLASVLFVDLVNSTGDVVASDPEVVRRRVNSFFGHVSRCIETHGGTVEKFAGDAVMAAFGIPRAHEDDAERALRAALAIQQHMVELGVEVRMGVEAGEVVVEDGDSTFATGEAVNLAARLQQAAPVGQIFVGPGAHRLAQGRIEFESVGDLELRGLPEEITVRRALCASDGHGRVMGSLEAPLVGRDTELDLLENTFERLVRNGRPHLFTIYGEPGVGKSRLAREFVASIEGATVLSGRCLPYGEGITYWPIAEMIKASAGITDDDPVETAQEKLLECCEDEEVADLLGLASGLLAAFETGERSQQEIAWAAREWAEKLAEVQPLVLVFEDIHWAEDPLLELVEHIAERAREAPILILCLARPELVENRPAWGGGRLRATAIELEPLPPDESERLVEALLADAELPEDVVADLLDKTEGNPLFVEETIRMLAEGNGVGPKTPIPDTLQALIAARIDRLPTAEKVLLQRAAVVGRVFWGGSLAHLSPELDDLDELIDGLLLRDLVQQQPRSTITGERAYRFKHVLIREVAYATLAKSARAAYHARFAEWLHERAGDELLEIRAYHLDQASALHAELDGAPPAELAVDAAEALESAGRRALAREAYRTARKLLVRSVELESTLERRWLAARAASRLNDWPVVAAEMDEVRQAAAAAGERKIHGRALTALAQVALYQRADVPRAHTLMDEALEVLSDAGHIETRFEALVVRADIANMLGDSADQEHYLLKALETVREADRTDLEAEATRALASAYLVTNDVQKARPLAERALELAAASGSLLARAQALQVHAAVQETVGAVDEAIETYEQSVALHEEIGFSVGVAYANNHLGRLALLKGDLRTAERRLRDAIKILKPLGDRGHLCESQRRLAQVLVADGRIDEAERYALEARETVGPEDAFSLISTKTALGVVRAAQGRDDEAEQLLREAADEIMASTFRSAEDQVLEPLVEFLRSRGRADEAEPLEARLGELYPAYAKSTAA